MALELVCGADFSWKLMCGAGPGDLGGSRGSASAGNLGKTGPKISSQAAFRYPVPVTWLKTWSVGGGPRHSKGVSEGRIRPGIAGKSGR